MNEINQYLLRLGFQLKFLAKNKVRIDGVPEDVKKGSEEKLLKDLISEYQQNQVEKNLEEKDNIAKSFSCKAAIKAGDKLSEKEMRLLIDQLFSTSMPYVCPHGRPILLRLNIEEILRGFKRI